MIHVRRLTKVFSLSPQKEIVAVDRVTFHVSPGEVYGLLGPNGAGKTTTLRMILGLLTPSGGQATIQGFSSRENPDEVKRRVGLVSTGVGVYPWLSAREMLLYFADLYGLSPTRARERLKYLAACLGMESFLDQRCITLSTGQKQRVNLARAWIHDPPVMLLDEPTLGLDVLGSQAVIEFVRLLRQEGKGVIVTTHRLEEAERICDRFGLMHQGRLRQEGTLAELRSTTKKETLVEMFLQLAGESGSVGGFPSATTQAEEHR